MSEIKHEAQYQYRCRMCNEVHTPQIGGWDNDIIGNEMFVATNGDSPVFTKAKIYQIDTISYHLCKDGSYGVCDFIGVKKIQSKL